MRKIAPLLVLSFVVACAALCAARVASSAERDSDRDGTPDDKDCAANDPTVWRNNAFFDTDADGVADTIDPLTIECYGGRPPEGYTDSDRRGPDNCLDMYNPDQLDRDGDGVGDACLEAADGDGDGVPDDTDCAPADLNRWQNQAYHDVDGDDVADSLEQTAVACYGYPAPEGYTDWLEDGADNCPGVFNPEQSDSDGNGLGDGCDSPEAPRVKKITLTQRGARRGTVHLRRAFRVSLASEGSGPGSAGLLISFDNRPCSTPALVEIRGGTTTMLRGAVSAPNGYARRMRLAAMNSGAYTEVRLVPRGRRAPRRAKPDWAAVCGLLRDSLRIRREV